MPWARDWLSWVLLGLAVAGFVVGLSPYWEEAIDPATGDRETEVRLGLATSPLYHWARREPTGGGYHITSRVGWVSWSALGVLAGLAGLAGFRERRAALRARPAG